MGSTTTSIGDFLTKPGFAAAVGLVAAALSLVIRGKRYGEWHPNLPSILVAFLGGATIPLGTALVIYPFLDNPPKLDTVVAYLPVSGLALLWVAYITVKQAAEQNKTAPP